MAETMMEMVIIIKSFIGKEYIANLKAQQNTKIVYVVASE